MNEELILKLSNNYTSIISIDIIKENKNLYWGGNGVGDRWQNKKYNYAVIYSNKKYKIYSENNEDNLDDNIINNYQNKRINIITIPINKKNYKEIVKNNYILNYQYL